jgi:transposase
VGAVRRATTEATTTTGATRRRATNAATGGPATTGGRGVMRPEQHDAVAPVAAPAAAVVSPDGNDVGADPHKRTLTASVLDRRGGVLGTASFPVSGDGHRALEAWVAGFGPVRRFGIEGASGLGRHTAMFLIRAGHDVRDVCPNRTNDRDRARRRGKSDAIDSVKIAREVQADEHLPVAFKRAGGDAGPDETTECLQLWHQARRSLLKSRQHLLNEAEALLVALPEEIRAHLPDTSEVRPRLASLADVDQAMAADTATRTRLGLLETHRVDVAELDRRETEIATELKRLVGTAGSTLSQLVGIAERSDAELLVEVGDPRRFTGEGGFARFKRHRPPARFVRRGRRPTDPPSTQPGRQPQVQRHSAPHGCHPTALRTPGPGHLRQRPLPGAHQERSDADPQASPLQRRLPPDDDRPQPPPGRPIKEFSTGRMKSLT